MANFSLKQLYGLAYHWALEKESTLPQDEITRQVSVITDYLDFVWKHKYEKASTDKIFVANQKETR